MTTIYDFEVRAIDGTPVPLTTYRDQVLLVVNTASACGFTPQFAGLESLYQRYKTRGLTVLGFPSNQFGNQDPGSNEEILAFCTKNYGVSFPMMEKIRVRGEGAEPLYQWLMRKKPGLLGSGIKWNFTKFLIGRDGQPIRRYAPFEQPASLSNDIERALKVSSTP